MILSYGMCMGPNLNKKLKASRDMLLDFAHLFNLDRDSQRIVFTPSQEYFIRLKLSPMYFLDEDDRLYLDFIEPCEATTRTGRKTSNLRQRVTGNVAKKVGPVKTDLINPDDKIMDKDLTITHLRVGLPVLVYALDLIAFSYGMYKEIEKFG
jgi:hypothetical protein